MNILITGASRGLGIKMVRSGLDRGHRIYAGVRNKESAMELTALQGQYPGQFWIINLDVTLEESVREAAEHLSQEGTGLDAIINNAAVLLGRDQKLEDIEINDVQSSFEVNLYGAIRVVKHFLPLLNKSQLSTVINISSEAGSMANAYGGDYAYAMSKAALNMFSIQLKKYLQEEGGKVYAVHPGWIRTDMGGEQAPGDPTESAKGILDILERKVSIGPEATFIDYKGRAMHL